ncbi:NUDIX hydrolase [Angustibacter aerolatus]
MALLRDGDHGPEAFLLRRKASMAFAARMHVFPGGGVDPRDDDADVPWAGPPLDDWAQRLGVGPGTAAGLVCAAVRELFEESGVLLAGPDAGAVVADTSGPAWEADRQALLDRELALSQLLVRRGLVLRSDLLSPWAHWCTPVFEPRRYDTWFFLAELPAGQVARDVGGEADEVAWLPASDALAGHERGELTLMPPTQVVLEDVAALPSVRQARSVARVLQRVVPWLAARPGDEPVIRVDLDGHGGGRPGPASGLEVLR